MYYSAMFTSFTRFPQFDTEWAFTGDISVSCTVGSLIK